MTQFKPIKRGYSKNTSIPKASKTERALQIAAEKYLRNNKRPYFRIRDSVYRTLFGHTSALPLGERSAVAKFFKSFPDLLLFNVGTSKYLMIELKGDKGVLSSGQKVFQALHKDNYKVIKDIKSFTELVEGFYSEGEQDETDK